MNFKILVNKNEERLLIIYGVLQYDVNRLKLGREIVTQFAIRLW